MIKLAICGRGRCGKDTVAEMIASQTSLRYVSGTSRWAAGIVFDLWGHRFYKSKLDCWNDRHQHREKWAELIIEYNKSDPVKLYSDCLVSQDILTGLRSFHEMKACMQEGLVDLWIWVERSGCVDKTMEFSSNECDIVIENNSTISELARKVTSFCRLLRNYGYCES